MAESSSVLITGGNGFLGTAVIQELLMADPECRIIVLDKAAAPPENLQTSTNLQYFQADITNPSEVLSVFRATQPDAVIHSAGLIPPLSERYQRRLQKEIFNVNVNGTKIILEAAKQAKCKAFVYTSSCCAVTDDLSATFANIDETWPVSPKSTMYGESKVQAEIFVLAAQEPNFPVCILRPAVMFGENDQQLIPSIYACIPKRETSFVIGDGQNLWDTCYVGNAAAAHVLALKNLLTSRTAAGEIFFIQNEPVTFREFCLEIWKNFEHFPPFEIKIPQSFGWLIGSLAEWYSWAYGKPTTLSRGSVMDACAVRYASGRKARELLGFVPKVGLAEGIRSSCLWHAKKLQERGAAGMGGF